ncbi:MAG TPA: TonB-dependent receptor [Arenimonas sp.]|uniref:TonB-dependent receptor family protein n=1 Tax=Arenimonas sp. TaxID=1872635 RepID=UPI002D7E1A64|nr:TonB-dependent receptor [Arenimonas sp.]HEU0154060.1 TonB-dependent receptor [Arenimonas sp.]
MSRIHAATAGALALALALPPACAEEAEAAAPAAAAAAPTLDPVNVTATRRAASVFDTPAAVSVRTLPDAAPGLNLSEWLGGIPGLLARDRQNYAQDTQVSIRGFGTRASFGIRGLRVIIDGIPATQPDGQSQLSHANLASAERVEVLRGPFSALYGNSSGGVIQVFSGDGRAPGEANVAASGSDAGDWRVSAGLRTRWRGAGVVAGLSRLRVEGFRPHSAAERTSFNARLHWPAGGGEGVALVFNAFDAPEAQDPLGLDRAQFAADPGQVAPQALDFDTRKSVRQVQLGGTWSRGVGSAELQAMAYAGQRDVLQFLAIPVFVQGNPLQSGGVVDLGSDYGGGELRLAGESAPAGRPLQWTVGLGWEGLVQQRRGFENFAGDRLGVRGTLRRDERNAVASFDQFAQADWRLAERWSLQAGLRHSRLRFTSSDRYVTDGNPDDSGAVDFERWTPVLALQWRLQPGLNLHASFGSGFETPTLVELAYRPDGGSGLNLDLRPARSRSLELGMKWRPRPGLGADLALFRADTRDELVVATNAGGRASFTNAARTRRQGLELALNAALGEAMSLQLGFTRLDARMRQDYLACAGAPCLVPTQWVASGTRLAGVPASQGRLRWEGWRGGMRGFAEVRGLSAVGVNDVGSERAPGYALLDLGLTWAATPRVEAFVRLDNALDRRHVGSVITNDGNGRFYEPGAPRTLWLGLALQRRE